MELVLFGFSIDKYWQIKSNFSNKWIRDEERIKNVVMAKELGHASFGYLKKLFSNLFKSHDVLKFKYDVCELTKNHRMSFLLTLNIIT